LKCEGVQSTVAASGLLAGVTCQVILEERGARRRLARKKFLPTFWHL
jgi:hypothetical protein